MDPQLTFAGDSPLSLAVYLPLWLCGRQFNYSEAPRTALSALITSHPDLFKSLKNATSEESDALYAEMTTPHAALEQLDPQFTHTSSNFNTEKTVENTLNGPHRQQAQDECSASELAELLSLSAQTVTDFLSESGLSPSEELHPGGAIKRNLHCLLALQKEYFTGRAGKHKEMLRASQLSLLALLSCSQTEAKVQEEAVNLLNASNELVLFPKETAVAQVMTQLEMLKLRLLQADGLRGCPAAVPEALKAHSEIVNLAIDFYQRTGRVAEVPLFHKASPQGLLEPLQHEKAFIEELSSYTSSLYTDLQRLSSFSEEIIITELAAAESLLEDSPALAQFKEEIRSLQDTAPSSATGAVNKLTG